MSLPSDYQPRTGDKLIDLRTGEQFTVLCNCSRSQPRKYTRRYIAHNPEHYALPNKESQHV